MLTLTAQVQAKIDAGELRRVWLIEMQMKTATDRIWTGGHDLTYNSQTWFGDVVMLLGDYEQTQRGDIVPHSITFGINDPTRLNQILAVDEIPHRPIIFHDALFDETTSTLVPDPILVYQRQMRPGKQNLASNTWILYADHPMVSALYRSRRTRTDPDQRKIFAPALGENDDRFFIDVVNRPSNVTSWPKDNWQRKRGR